MKISKNYLQQKRDPHLHTLSHVLADELSNKLGDKQHFGYYLKTALTTDHNVLRYILGGILEGSSKQPGALFAFLVKKYNREKDITQGYSLWLVPSEETFKALSGIIQTLAQTFNTPVFKPHITLLSGLENENAEAIEKLSETKALVLAFKPATTGEEFFKSLFLPAEKTKQLLALKRLAKQVLQIDTTGTYIPHLSLMYGNIPDTDKKNALKELGLTLPTRIVFDRLALVKTTGRTADWKTKQLINLQQDDES